MTAKNLNTNLGKNIYIVYIFQWKIKLFICRIRIYIKMICSFMNQFFYVWVFCVTLVCIIGIDAVCSSQNIFPLKRILKVLHVISSTKHSSTEHLVSGLNLLLHWSQCFSKPSLYWNFYGEKRHWNWPLASLSCQYWKRIY